MQALKILTAAAILVVMSGCSTIFGDHASSVNVTSQPSGAQVFLDNQPVGRTPMQVEVGRPPVFGTSPQITVRRKGYDALSRRVSSSFQPVGILNIFFWPGFIIDAATSNTMKIANESRNINFHLDTAAKS